MVLKITVSAQNKVVDLVHDESGLRIEGDFTKKGHVKSSRVCCFPFPPQETTASPLAPIANTNILHAVFDEDADMVQLAALIPRESSRKKALDLYTFRYNVEKEKRQEAVVFCQTMMDNVYRGIKPEKRLIVLVNPFGGQGKAKHIYEKQVAPVFQAARCRVHVEYTQYSGHARDIAKSLDPELYDAIVTVSGDGVIHEVINGLLERADAREVLRRLPLGVIPAGTGNALSICLLGEVLGFDPVHTALQVIKGADMPLDLCSITYAKHRYFSFLSQNYGITSYADLATENMRWMGDARTVLGLLREIVNRKTYKMKAAIKVVEEDKERIKALYRGTSSTTAIESPFDNVNGQVLDTIPPLSEPVPDDWKHIEGDMVFFLASKLPWLARGMLSHPCAQPNDALLDVVLVQGHPSILQQLDVFGKVETGKQMDSNIVEYYKAKAFRLTPIVQPGEQAYVAIDGEHAPVEPFQVEVHPGLARVLSLHTTYVDTGV